MELPHCSECSDRHEHHKHSKEDLTPPKVLQVCGAKEVTIFHTVEITPEQGDDSETSPVRPMNGKYRNMLVRYLANNHAYAYNSDGIYTQVSWGDTARDFNQLDNRPKYAGQTMTGDTNIPDFSNDIAGLRQDLTAETSERQENVSELSDKIDAEEDARETAVAAVSADLEQEIADRTAGDTAIEDLLDKVVVTDFSVNDTPSTTSIILDGAKENLKTGATSTSSITLPVASGSQAGVMNTSTYNAIQENSQNIDAILGGSVAISSLPAEPTQQQLTTAWRTATGLTTLINGAKIFDVTNEKNWTYYTNTTTWYATDAGGSTTVSTATNTSLGIVMGDATTGGKVFVESNGTMSVNNWDTTINNVSDNTANIASLQAGKVDKITGKGLSTNDYTTAEKNKLAGIAAGAEINVQSNWNQTTTTADDYIKNKPTLGSLASKNTISTNDINNSAVTSDKINWSSLKGDFPVYANGEVSLGFGLICIVYRVCNMVFVNGTTVSSNVGHGTITLSETWPSWAVPVNGVTASINGSLVDGQSTNLGWDIKHDGTMVLRSSQLTITGLLRVNVSGAWVTDADWPE